MHELRVNTTDLSNLLKEHKALRKEVIGAHASIKKMMERMAEQQFVIKELQADKKSLQDRVSGGVRLGVGDLVVHQNRVWRISALTESDKGDTQYVLHQERSVISEKYPEQIVKEGEIRRVV